MSTDLFLAVDGGNSKTVALVVDRQGAVLGRARAGCGDIYGAASPEAAVAEVLAAARDALSDAEASPSRLVSAAFRIAGVDWSEDGAFWDDLLPKSLPGLTNWTVKNDGFASLRLAELSGVGVSITVGTGPAVVARTASGQEACLGWWCLDHLGGSGLGALSLRAVYRNYMGLDPDTVLTARLLELFGVPDVVALRHGFTRHFGAWPESRQWQAARVVLECAGAGDAVAQGLVDYQAKAFVSYAGWVARQVGVELAGGDLPVVLSGSILTSKLPAMREAVHRELDRVDASIPRAVASGAPIDGVVLDALAEGGVDLTETLRETIVTAQHPTEFLTTD